MRNAIRSSQRCVFVIVSATPLASSRMGAQTASCDWMPHPSYRDRLLDSIPGSTVVVP